MLNGNDTAAREHEIVINFCPMCGKELSAEDKTCSGCGLSVDEYKKKLERLYAEMEADDIKKEFDIIISTPESRFDSSDSKGKSHLGKNFFSILGYSHFYNSEFVEYNSVRKVFVKNAYERRKEFSAECVYSVHNFDEFYSVGLKVFERKIFATAALSVEEIKKHRRINISPEELLAICYREGLINLEDFVAPLKKIYNDIAAVAEQIAIYRGLERSTRSRWEGGGFGFSGAIKGAIKAGVLNLATDAVRG